MEFKEITTLLQEYDLENPKFSFLKPDHELYDILLYQPSHDFEAQPTHLRSSERDLVTAKVSGFLEIASDKSVNLVVTPEYSTPWDVIIKTVENDNFPNEDSLWVLGSESIQPKDFQEKVSEHEEAIWIYDKDLIEKKLESENFLNPLCYLFKTKNDQGDEKNVIAVQFKTHPLGGNPYERDNMICGTNIYVFDNDGEDSITLRTFICSDTINPKLNEEIANLSKITPHLFLHIQLNSSPCDGKFSGYRNELFGYDSDCREVICLNWGRNIDGNIKRYFGASALYSKISPEGQPELSHTRVNNNHNSGLYYTWSKGKKNNYYFNFDEHVFYLRNTKASQAMAAGPMTKRTGPEVLESFKWTQNEKWEQYDHIDDGFDSLCESIEGQHVNLETLKNNDDLTPVDKERLLTLSIGKAINENWYKINRGKFFSVNSEEHIKRFTFVHHPNEDVVEQRKKLLLNYAKLENKILNNDDKFPDRISDLKSNCKINYISDNSSFNFNLYPKNEGPATTKATGIYLGTVDKSDAKKVFKQTENLFKNKEDPRSQSQLSQRVVVWYQDNNDDIHCISPKKNPGPFNTNEDGRSFKKKTG